MKSDYNMNISFNIFLMRFDFIQLYPTSYGEIRALTTIKLHTFHSHFHV